MPYAEALELQRRLVAARRAGQAPDTLLLLEHPPVVTLGRSAHEEHLDRAALAARGVEVHAVGRGGDVTYHGPGQLVGYPVIDLAERGEPDVHAYLRALEALLIEALADLGVPARSVPGWTGVFVAARSPAERPRKIASIGVALRGWVTHHGFALNVDVDLAGFEPIVACGLREVDVTSVARELAAPPPDLGRRARDAVSAAFSRRFGAARAGPGDAPRL